jgi:hypothetical protein
VPVFWRYRLSSLPATVFFSRCFFCFSFSFFEPSLLPRQFLASWIVVFLNFSSFFAQLHRSSSFFISPFLSSFFFFFLF